MDLLQLCPPHPRRWVSLVFFGLYLCIAPTNPEGASSVYQFLDNKIFTVPILSRGQPTPTPGGSRHKYDQRFPPPPLFPPPPPSWNDDTNALLREAVFATAFSKIRKTLKGDGEDNSTPNNPGHNPGTHNNPGTHKGTTDENMILPTDVPSQCTEFLTPPPNGWTGPAGTPGPPGPPGPAGQVGPEGPPGQRGRRGRKGLAGPVGPTGGHGPLGHEGPSGPVGDTGRPGLPGRDGPAGQLGPMGPRGLQGRDGPAGPTGSMGPEGPAGTNGMPGLVIFQNAAAMYGVHLEGLIAYRADSKQLFFRDHVTWRAIRVTKCGDGILDRDTGEACDDGNDSPNDSCVGCRRAYCGDGFIHLGQEECDGRDFGGQACSSWKPGMIGRLFCTARCKISYSRCRYPRR